MNEIQLMGFEMILEKINHQELVVLANKIRRGVKIDPVLAIHAITFGFGVTDKQGEILDGPNALRLIEGEINFRYREFLRRRFGVVRK